MGQGRIEQIGRLRDEQPPDDSVVVIRGGPDTTDKLAKHAARTARAWSLDGKPLQGISVFCAIDATGDHSLDAVLNNMSSYRVVYLCPAGELRSAGIELLATATRPHYTLRSRGGGTLDVARLLAKFGVPQHNPFHHRRKDQPQEG